MKIFFVVVVARQIEGEMISIKFEKAFQQYSKAESYIKSLSKNYIETIQTDQGAVQFYCSRGLHEIELED